MLTKLLEKNRQFNPTYSNDRLTNHLSMALIALDKIGAPNERLQLFFDKYSQNLESVTTSHSTDQITSQNWKTYLGQRNYYNAYMLFFSQELLSSNITETLTKYVPTLIKGIATDAFHCIIRLAYAIDINEQDEIACALAYFASSSTFLNEGINSESISDNPETLLKKIQTIKSLSDKQFQDYTLIERFIKVTSIPEFSPIINWLLITDHTIKDCAKTAIRLYASTKNFTALHLVTTTHAFRILLPYLPNPKEALKYYWQAFCAAYISIGAPLINETDLTEFTPLPWKDIFAKATKASDDHIIKLIYSCYIEDQIYQNLLYNYIAAKLIILK